MQNKPSMDAEQLLEQALDTLNTGDLDKGISLLRQALEVRPDFIEARITLGSVLLALGEFDEAIDELETAVEEDENHPLAHFTLALALIYSDEEDEAREHLDRVVELAPELPVEIILDFSQQLLLAGMSDYARNLLQYAVERTPDNAEVWASMATAQLHLGQFAEARSAAEKALQLDNRWPVPHFILGQLALQEEKYPEAEAKFKEALALDPESHILKAPLASALAKQGKTSEAQHMVKDAIRHADGDPEVLMSGAHVYEELGMLQDAIATVRQVLLADPEDEDAMIRLIELATTAKDRKTLQWLREHYDFDDPELEERLKALERALRK